MANYESEGYCPHDSLLKTLSSLQDSRIFGLWYLIGENVVCINTGTFSTVNTRAVNEMFSTDPIAFRLLSRIINYNSKAKKFSIYQDYTDGCINMQSFDTIAKKFLEIKNPEIIVAANSKYTVIIGEDKNPDEIAVYFWDLTSCI